MGGPDECFNCAAPASEQYAIVLPHRTLQEKFLCDECAAAFRDEKWMEVHEGTVLMRGESGEEDDGT